MAIARILLVIQGLSGIFSESVHGAIVDLNLLVVLALLYMQIPAVLERICATVYYKTYIYWKCYGTLLIITACWCWSLIISLRIVQISQVMTLILLGVAEVNNFIVYYFLFKVNINRYKNGRSNQNLRDRYQVFETMQSLYPLFWTILLEMAYNIGTVVFVGAMTLMNKGDNYFGFDTGLLIANICREMVVFLYCLPFLFYSEKRRRTNFIKKMGQEKQDEHNLYFKQLKEQW